MRTSPNEPVTGIVPKLVGMKPLSERDENSGHLYRNTPNYCVQVGMKPLSERDENVASLSAPLNLSNIVGMKPLSERDENCS